MRVIYYRLCDGNTLFKCYFTLTQVVKEFLAILTYILAFQQDRKYRMLIIVYKVQAEAALPQYSRQL